MSRRGWGFAVVLFLLGVALGGWLFGDTQRRSLLAVTECDDCWTPQEVSGLAASVLVQRAPGWVPRKVFESEHTLVIDHPFPQGPAHFVLIPKRDIKHVGAAAPGDEAALVDLWAVAARLIDERRLHDYRLWTNGPGAQAVGYLHFHLVGDPR